MPVTLDLPQGFLAFLRITWETAAHGKAFVLLGLGWNLGAAEHPSKPPLGAWTGSKQGLRQCGQLGCSDLSHHTSRRPGNPHLLSRSLQHFCNLPFGEEGGSSGTIQVSNLAESATSTKAQKPTLAACLEHTCPSDLCLLENLIEEDKNQTSSQISKKLL